jgi:arylsulfatase A-like enzyme
LVATTFVDEQIGLLLQALAESDYADNTVIALLSDHGMQLGEKQNWGKETLWERSTHVPFMIAYPGGERSERIDRPVELVSLFPTLVDLCGLPQPADVHFDGPSLVPLIRDPELTWEYPVITSLGEKTHTVRTDRWRYIRYADGSEELYDHENDPNEWSNLASDELHEARLLELARLLPKDPAPDVANR